ncbi:MAG: hypothetical protein AAGH43_05055 [Pseudomonadota bacterium]
MAEVVVWVIFGAILALIIARMAIPALFPGTVVAIWFETNITFDGGDGDGGGGDGGGGD